MRIENDPRALQAEVLRRRAGGQIVGFVPTMGYLHAGHTALMDLARARCDCLVASIYVNPLQFAPHEDLARYPRDPEGDADKCRGAGVDLLLMPPDLYAPGHATRVRVAGAGEGLESETRPHFFEGVATVVARLFGLVQPHLAVFGEKDYQQLAVIRQMVADLALPIEIIGGPLIRDADGLALSSRNRYLSAADRGRALSLVGALRAMQAALEERGPGASAEELRAPGLAALDVDRLDYLAVVDPLTLRPVDRVEGEVRALVAAVVGGTRLIDNLALRP